MCAAVETTVMIGNSEVDGTRVEMLLNDTNMKLAKIDRSHLRTEDGSTCQQATEFAHAARRALEEGDYLVGSGLAEEACILTNTIARKASSP